MTTIRRTVIILIMLALAFFIYRAITPTGADRLLNRIKTVPTSLGISSSTGSVFASSLASGGMTSLDALFVLSSENVLTGNLLSEDDNFVAVDSGASDIPSTGSETTAPSVATKPVVTTPVASKPAATPASSTHTSSLSSDIAFLNTLFK